MEPSSPPRPLEPSDAPCVYAILGGAFDPPHVGHVLAAHYVLLTGGVRKVLVVPCAEHPFGKIEVSFVRRLEMCRLAFAGLGDAVEVLDIEGRREGASYTIDTVRELAALHPGVRFEIIIGSDNLRDLPRWKGIEELKRLAGFRVLPRLEEEADAEVARDSAAPAPVGACGAAGKISPKAAAAAARTSAPEAPPAAPFCLPLVSSTTVRERLARGADVSAYVPRAVADYIKRHALYASREPGA